MHMFYCKELCFWKALYKYVIIIIIEMSSLFFEHSKRIQSALENCKAETDLISV